MENEFDIKLGNITCIFSEKIQKLVDYRDNFKYETPHKKPFLFDFTYFGNQDCPHVLNNEALEIIKDKIEKFESVIILLKVNNRNKRGLDKLIENISKILNNKSAVLFLCNPFDGLQSLFKDIYNLDNEISNSSMEYSDLKPYMLGIDMKSPLYLKVMNDYSYTEIAKMLDMTVPSVKNKLYCQKRRLIHQIIKNNDEKGTISE